MLSRRRFFAGCALCSAMGLVATSADAQTPSATRTVLQSLDVPGTNHVTHIVMVEFAAGALNARHTHPGTTLAYILDGELELSFPDRTLTAKRGDSFNIGVGVPHAERGGPSGARALVTFTVEKGKPLASPAPE